jgi:hypothetical protein
MAATIKDAIKKRLLAFSVVVQAVVDKRTERYVYMTETIEKLCRRVVLVNKNIEDINEELEIHEKPEEDEEEEDDKGLTMIK